MFFFSGKIGHFNAVIAFTTNIVAKMESHYELRSFIEMTRRILNCDIYLPSANRVFDLDKILSFEKRVDVTDISETEASSDPNKFEESGLVEYLENMQNGCKYENNEDKTNANCLYSTAINSYVDNSPKCLLKSLKIILSAIGPFGTLAAAKKFKFDLKKISVLRKNDDELKVPVESNDDKSDNKDNLNSSEDRTNSSIDLTCSLSFQIACSVELYCLELVSGDDAVWKEKFQKGIYLVNDIFCL